MPGATPSTLRCAPASASHTRSPQYVRYAIAIPLSGKASSMLDDDLYWAHEQGRAETDDELEQAFERAESIVEVQKRVKAKLELLRQATRAAN